MKVKKIIYIIAICFMIIFNYNNVYTNNVYANSVSKEQGFWKDASKWFRESKNNNYTLPEQATQVIGEFTDMINVIGTTVIVIATIVLGIKYMISSVDAKASAKEGLITLFVACVFFFGWTSISGLLFPNNNFIFIDNFNDDTSYTKMLGRIFSTFAYIAKIVAILVVIYVGVKYILSGASGKADLKGKSVNFIIGIILVFATTNVLDFISRLINDTFK